jgi:hypothetical protein
LALLLKVVGKNDEQRQVMINSIAPHCGNQVWLITTAGGALLPPGYRSTPRRLVVLSGDDVDVSGAVFTADWFDYRSKLENVNWRSSRTGVLPRVRPIHRLFWCGFWQLIAKCRFADDICGFITGSFCGC